ncbi:beta-lactamase family protein [Rhizodiscina lignyota]|uniref:Beta-lactamase family protein n=1 Tax=Rhizodiscina lignyota TaxID=1504668 RepID=A0A9P4IFC7_9PEZI|nr:beta-lactamase family protein [Rhizodiscina lignyota]
MRPQFFNTPEFKNLVDDTLKACRVPGLAIAVIDNDEISVRNFGLAALPSTPITDVTLFDCASTSKSFTSAALALLVDDDTHFPDVKWETPVSRLLPDDFVMSDARYTEELTIEDILSHRTGLPGHDDALMGETAANPDTPRSVTRLLRHLPVNKSMRTEYQYSNIMFTVASHLVEVLTGTSFRSFLETRLWGPLGMENTHLQVRSVEERNLTERLSRGYRWDKETGMYVELPWWRQYEGQGAGDVFSCVSDYAKWVRCMMHRVPPLSENAHKELIKPRTICNPGREARSDDKKLFSHELYALGLEVQTYHSHTLIGHDGCVSGYESKICYFPDWNWGVVIFGNGTGADDVAEVVRNTLIDEVLGVAEKDRLNWSEVLQKRKSERQNEDEEPNPWHVDPKDSLPLPLPLLDLAGTYHNPGYRTITLLAEGDRLIADCTDRTFPFKLYLEHTSDTRFTAEYHYVGENIYDSLKAQFQLPDDGKGMISFGVALSEDMRDDLIWFEKVRDD